MKKNIISLHGSYFSNNYGDILLINLFAKWIKEYNAEFKINLPKANNNVIGELPTRTNGLFNLIKSNALIFCGGGYFGEQPQNPQRWALRNFFRHAIVAFIAKIFNIPYVIIGVEFGPISSNWFRKVCIAIAKKAKYVVVRNQESYDFLKANGVIKNVLISADAVLSLSDIVFPLQTYNIKHKKILIHFNGKSKLPENYEYVAKTIISSVRKCFEDYTLVFLSDSNGNYYDNDICKKIFADLNRNNIPYEIKKYEGYKNLIDEINSSYCIFTSKLHVGITAAALNKKVFSLWFHNKTPRLHAQIGNSSYCVAFDLVDKNLDSKIQAFLKSPEYILPLKAKESALLNKEILYKFLSTEID